jgi:CO/xanthine dehydrogenase Mo-binding subunit
MRDGRIIARSFTGYFDPGAYMRLSSYAIIKARRASARPLHDPECIGECLLRLHQPETPATAMRGFGITGVDFAIEAHMDKVADTVGLRSD